MSFISNQIIPHFTFLDSLHAVGQIFRKNTENIDFQKFLGTKNYVLTNSARTALSIIIDVINLPKNKKIGIPAFICAVVATPFLEKGYEIEWLDTDENGLVSVKNFEKKSQNIGLVVVPHIFGQKAPIREIFEIAHEKNIFVVEDGAHRLDTASCNYFDAKILSFGREKVISCVSGGALIWPENSIYEKKFLVRFQKCPFPSFWWTFRHLCQPFIFAISLPWWHVGGKIIPWIFRKIKFLPLAVSMAEKEGKEDFFIGKMPHAMQKILLRQFKKTSKRKIHAQMLAKKWEIELKKIFPKSEIIIPENFFRVIIKISGADKSFFSKISTKNRFFFSFRDWDGIPISPKNVCLEKFGYTMGQCPKAEAFSANFATFPTNIRTDKNAPNRWAGAEDGI